MQVKEIMIKKVITVSPEMTCQEIAKLLFTKKISGAPVVDNKGKLIGIVSEKDIFRAFYPSYQEFYERPVDHIDFDKLESEAINKAKKKVAEVMTKELITVSPDTPILKIGALMIARGIHRVPVVDKEKLVGIVTRRDIYRSITKTYLE